MLHAGHHADSTQHVHGLEMARQRQIDVDALARGVDREVLAAARQGPAVDQAQVGRGMAVGDDRKAARAAAPGVDLELRHVGVEHRDAIGIDQVEQPRLGLAVSLQGRVIVEVVLGQVGEAGRRRAGRRRAGTGAGRGSTPPGRRARSRAARGRPARDAAWRDRAWCGRASRRRSRCTTPSVPSVAASSWPSARQSWRQNSATEVLPLVPVTAIAVAGWAP